MVKVKEDLTGKIFHRLTVKRQAEDYISPTGIHRARWVCECSCDNKTEVIVLGSQLKNGHTQSCGCLSREKSAERCKAGIKENYIDDSGDFAIGYTEKGEEFWFDKEDYDKIKDYCWFYDKNGYVRTNSKPRNIFLHRLVLGIPFKEKGIDQDVDHIVRPLKGGLVFDNRKQNLRICTRSENCMNVKHKGITKTKYGKWSAQIKVNKKVIYLGVFETEELATKARRDAEQIYHKDFAYKHDAKRNLDELEELV